MKGKLEKKNGWKEFFRPAWSKIVLTFILFVIYIATVFICLPWFIETFPESTAYREESSAIYSCGEYFTRILMIPFSLSLFWFIYIVIFYLISCFIVLIYYRKRD